MGKPFYTLITTFLAMVTLVKSQETCIPVCGPGFLCHQNQCVSACNPPCPGSQVCTAEAECLEPRQSAAVSEEFVAEEVSKPGMMLFRILIGNGYTAVDIPAASGYGDNDLDDWYQGNHGFSLQGFLGRGHFLMGAEIGYEHLYSWWASPRYGATDLYYQNQWWTFFLGPIGLMRFGPFHLVAGADLHFFDAPVLGLSAGAGINIPLGSRLKLPVEFRAKPVFGDGRPTVLQLNVGLMFGSGVR